MSAIPLGADNWECESCTYINKPTAACCEMCFTLRMTAKDLPVQWEWKADEKWIPYDLPSTLQIEEAFKQGKSPVRLSQGYFEDNPGYDVHFSKNRLYQINTHTGMRRTVRRIADEDSTVFSPAPSSITLKDEQCSICQENLAGCSDDLEPVKLPKCANHFFHRKCIASWVKLKGYCAFCRTPV